MKSRRHRLKVLAVAAYQTLDEYLRPSPRVVEEPLGGNGANAVLIVTDQPIGAPLAKEIVDKLDEELGVYTVRIRRGGLSFLFGMFAFFFIIALLIGTVDHILNTAYGVQDDLSRLLGSLGSWLFHW